MSRYEDESHAIFKAKTLAKFREEQNKRMGGNKAPITASVCALLSYTGCARYPLQIKKVPYRLMLGTAGYIAGI